MFKVQGSGFRVQGSELRVCLGRELVGDGLRELGVLVKVCD